MSCNSNIVEKNNINTTCGNITKSNLYINDTLSYKMWSSKKICTGKRLYPLIEGDIDLTIQSAKDSGISLVLEKSRDSTVIVVNETHIFTSYIDSIITNYSSDEFFQKNNLRVEELEEPYGAYFYGNDCDSIILCDNTIEYFHVCKDSPILQQFFGNSRSFTKFLLSQSIFVKQENIGKRVLLINIHEVSGSWFNEHINKYVKPLESSISEILLYHYNFELNGDEIVGVEISLVTTY
jgi:hypothetical protein